MLKRSLLAMLVGLLVFGAVVAFASNVINITPAFFGAGSADFVPCETNVEAKIGPLTGGLPGKVDSAIVTLDELTCDGAELTVQLTNDVGAVIAQGSVTVSGGSLPGPISVPTSPDRDPFDVHDINVFLSGP